MGFINWLRHFFTPHHSNRHRARFLHPSVLAVMVAFFLVYQFGINFALLFQPSILGYASNVTPEKVLELTNQERLKQGLPPLKMNNVLSQAAQLKAGDMFAFNYWAHNSPSGRTPWDFINQVGYQYQYAGENLARDFNNSESVVQAWMNSPTHKDNIVNSNYQEIGLAVVDGTLDGTETTLVVQLFGTPTPSPAKPTSSNQASITPEAPSQVVAEPAQAASEEELGLAEPEQELETVPAVIASARRPVKEHFLLSPFLLTKGFAVPFLSLMTALLALDVVWLYRRKVVRLNGKNVAHLIFVGALLLTAIMLSPGAIL